jgi:transcription initiation factor TFIIB
MGEYVCQSCARVVMDHIDDFGPESNSSDYEERSKNTRASGSSSYSMHDYGLRTEIGSTSKDYAGKDIDYKIQEQMTNVRKWQTRIRVASTKERRLSKDYQKLMRYVLFFVSQKPWLKRLRCFTEILKIRMKLKENL